MATEDAERRTVRPEEIRAGSDRLLAELEELRALERQKRSEDISTPPFHELADAVERQARLVWHLAAEEEEHVEATEPSGMSVDDLAQEGDGTR